MFGIEGPENMSALVVGIAAAFIVTIYLGTISNLTFIPFLMMFALFSWVFYLFAKGFIRKDEIIGGFTHE